MDTVVVSVIGIQRDQTGEENRQELITVGRHYQKNSLDYIRYEESAVSGLEGTKTTLKISDKRLIVLRSGKVQQRLVFQQDSVNDSLYRTPLGNFNLSVKTNKLTVELNEGFGQIQVAYELLLDGQWQSANRLVIGIREERKS